MTVRLTSLVLLLALVSGVSAGMPLHSNEQECSMGMTDMDCCKKAAMGQGTADEVMAARLCCALNCPETGSTSSSVNVPQPLQLTALLYGVAAELPKLDIPTLRGTAHSLSPPKDSHPTYIRNHSLLI